MDESSVMGTPFDLHVLSTPPAFILSQDQTLNKMVFKQVKLVKSILLKQSLLQRNLTVVFKRKACLQPNPNWCFVFVTLFNLQGAHRFSAGELILPHRFRLVKNFFQVFQTFSFSQLRSSLLRSRLATALIEYHPFQEMSSSFLSFFDFFEILSFLKEFISEARILPFPKRPKNRKGQILLGHSYHLSVRSPLIYFRNIPKHQVAHKKSALHP